MDGQLFEPATDQDDLLVRMEETDDNVMPSADVTAPAVQYYAGNWDNDIAF